ncbi:hypothetical protein [Gymnodinialimonas hymeniacidonis]|uniref:hypothetical protein n=1 Tax=Gymnodinialimonas hymeniacidonis TaxID=3126508 RepID=UPI0034C5E9C1
MSFVQMSQEIQDFFYDKAYAYTKGQLEYLSLVFLIPFQFSIGSQFLSLGTSQEVKDLFANYRSILLDQRNTKTTAEVLQIATVVDGTPHCLVNNASFDRARDMMGVENAS